jgi:hypothetical protein
MDQPDPQDPSPLPPPPAAPQGFSPEPTTRQIVARNDSPTPGILVVAGGALAVVGVLLPWLTATAPGGSVSENGIQIGTWGTLILGGFAVMRGLSMLRPAMFRIQLGTPIVGGILILGLMALRWGALQDAITRAEAVGPGVTANTGIGVWAVIAGGLCVVAGGLLQMRSLRRRP